MSYTDTRIYGAIRIYGSRILIAPPTSAYTQFQTFIYSLNFDVVGVTETWLSNMILDKEIIPYGYSIYRKDRTSRGGGVLVAIKNTISSRLVQSPLNLELIAVELIEINYLVFVVYLPPNIDIILLKETISFIKQYCSSNLNVIIIGDFNLPDINWLSLVGFTKNIFCDFVFECDLSQLVTVPTHCKENCLDLVLTNSPHAINNVQVGSCSVMKSDHLLVSFSLTTQFRPSVNVHETQYVINFSKLNYL